MEQPRNRSRPGKQRGRRFPFKAVLNRVGDEVEDVAILLPTGFDRGEQGFNETAAIQAADGRAVLRGKKWVARRMKKMRVGEK